MYTCEYCHQTFTRHSARKRHTDKVCKNKPKIHINITKKPDKNDIISSMVVDAITSLRDEVRQLRENQQPSNIYYNNNYTIVVGPYVFDQLVSKYGKDAAIHMLTQQNPTEVARSLYFTDEPDRYPIACKDIDHFRYINDKYEIIDDKGGSSISGVVSTNVKNAMITAANEVITDSMKGRHNPLTDISQLQNNLTLTDDGTFVKNLAKISFNPSHPFFRDIKQTQSNAV